MEATARKVTEHVEKVFSSLNKEFVRKSQRELFVCSAKCLEGNGTSDREDQICLVQCQQPFERITAYITSEANNLQNRLERCSMDCKDSAQDKTGSENTGAIQKEFESCVEKCANTCMSGLPEWHKRIRNNLQNNSY